MNKVLVSACLLGEKVRYDGDSKRLPHPFLERLLQSQSVVPFCPEVAGGMPIPRAAAEIIGGDGKAVLNGTAEVAPNNGDAVTAEFIKGAKLALEQCQQQGIQMAILTARSPSCGSGLIYDGSFSRKLTAGDGVTAALLKSNGIKVFNSEEIQQAEAFYPTLSAS